MASIERLVACLALGDVMCVRFSVSDWIALLNERVWLRTPRMYAAINDNTFVPIIKAIYFSISESITYRAFVPYYRV